MSVVTKSGLCCLIGMGLAVTLSGCGSSSNDGSSSTPSSSSGSATGDSSSPSTGSSAGSSAGGGGETGKSASQVLSDSKSALFDTKAVHVSGQVGSASSSGTKIDLDFQGQDAQGTVAVNGTDLRLVKTSGSVYIKAPTTFWSQTAGTRASALGGKWIKVAASKVPGLGNLTLQGIAASLNASGSALNPKTSSGTVAGQKAVIVTQKDGSQLFVADSGQPVPLKIVNHGKTAGTVLFTGYGKTMTIKPPAGAITARQALKSGGSKT